MKIAYNDQYKAKMVNAHVARMMLHPPPIPYKAIEKGNRSSADDRKTRTIDIKLDPSDQKSETISLTVTLFGHGTPEEYIKWRIEWVCAQNKFRDGPFFCWVPVQNTRTFHRTRTNPITVRYRYGTV